MAAVPPLRPVTLPMPVAAATGAAARAHGAYGVHGAHGLVVAPAMGTAPGRPRVARAAGSGGTAKAARGVVALGFTLAIVGGLTSLLQLSWSFGGWAFGLQWAFFLLQAWPQRSEKLYDASGSLTHLALILTALLLEPLKSPRQILLSLCAVVWCTRLGTFLFNRIAQDGKDTRFTELKKNFWTFSIAWNFQVLWVFLLQLPVTLVNSVPQPALGILDLLGLSMWCVGFLTEAVADGQKFAFRGKAENRKKFIKSGLWRFSRHPNYFGEILMWLGLCTSFMSCVTSGSQLLVWISPAFNALLLLRVSGVPMLEKAGEEKWGSDPEYQHYMKDPAAGFGCEDGRFWCEEGWCGSAAVLQLTEGGKLQQTSPKDRTCRVGKLFAPAVPIGAFFLDPRPQVA
ncbi:unnamed protein product [Durusdinium trenchii]|uniref:Steroid 5-alpha reductase C-terminal domain-containing protein n=1 Tax=Durusdinium trenchii TaxID=1381693 RepID=A0ABP0HKZ6_9DINO